MEKSEILKKQVRDIFEVIFNDVDDIIDMLKEDGNLPEVKDGDYTHAKAFISAYALRLNEQYYPLTMKGKEYADKLVEILSTNE